MRKDTSEKVLNLRSVFGVEARVTRSSADTGGAYVEMECMVEPRSASLIHYHPHQEETYQVLEGTLEVFREGTWRPVPTGESLTVPRGAVHAFRNGSSTPTRFLNVHRPALAFQEHLETLDRLIRSGKVRGTRDPRSLMYMSMSSVKHQPDVAVKPPQIVVNLMAWLGRRLRLTLD